MEILHCAAVFIGAISIFGIGWYFGRMTTIARARRPITEFRNVGLEQHDYLLLDQALGTGNVDPSSWGKIKLGPLTDKDLSEIAKRINDNSQTQVDAATLMLELKRIRLKDSSS